MEINKIVILFNSYKLKNILLNSSIFPYRNFLAGYYTTEIRKKTELTGYKVNFFDSSSKILASQEILSDIAFNKYAINREAIDEITRHLSELTEIKGKIVLLDEIGSFYLKFQNLTDTLLKILSSDKKMIIFSRNIKELKNTFDRLDDSKIIGLNTKTDTEIKKFIDNWLTEKIKYRELL